MKADEKVYEAYLGLRQSKLYFNQIKEHTGLSNSSLQNVLDKLMKNGILKLNKTKSNTFYQIKNKKIFSLKFSEIALNKFEALNLEVKSPLRNFLKEIPNHIFSIVLFGSASKKEEQKGSDIDVLIIEDKKTDLESLRKEINNLSNHPLSIFQCSTGQFRKNKDPVIIQAKKTGFPIYKEQNFYEVLLDEY